jgi:carbonic anhydrase
MNVFNAFVAAVCLPAVCLAMMTGCLAAQTPGAWNHNLRSDAGPLRWGSVLPADATCGSAPDLTGKPIVAVGAKQTPINIESTKVVPSELPSLGFIYNPTALEVENTGHVVEVMYQAGSFLRIGKSPSDDYKLVQFHFHAPSEHTVDGKSYDAELHLVHSNMLGEIAVVGVLLNASTNAKTGIYDDIVSLAPVTVSSASKESVRFNAKDLLPVSKSYYTYTLYRERPLVCA